MLKFLFFLKGMHAKSLNSAWFFVTPWIVAFQVTLSMGIFPMDKNTGVGSHYLLQGISLTQDQAQVSWITGSFLTIWASPSDSRNLIPPQNLKLLGAAEVTGLFI